MSIRHNSWYNELIYAKLRMGKQTLSASRQICYLNSGLLFVCCTHFRLTLKNMIIGIFCCFDTSELKPTLYKDQKDCAKVHLYMLDIKTI